MTADLTWLWTAGAVVLGVVVLLTWVVVHKGRPFTTGDVFRASRWSRGNHLLPTQVQIAPTSVVQYTPRWIGKREETIHMAHVSSVRVETGMLLSNLLIETSGGSDPIVCHGHTKGDAVRMKALIERYQTDYYRPGPGPAGSGPTGR